MPDIEKSTDKITLATAEEQAASGYVHTSGIEGQKTDNLVKSGGTEAPVAAQAKPQVSESSAAEATKTAGALLDAWFANSIHNSEYSRDATKYNGIQKAYRSLRVLIT